MLSFHLGRYRRLAAEQVFVNTAPHAILLICHPPPKVRYSGLLKESTSNILYIHIYLKQNAVYEPAGYATVSIKLKDFFL